MDQHDKLNRSVILAKTNGHCACCDEELDIATMTVDHYIPICRGGKSSINNLYPLCIECNQQKADELYYWEDCYPNLNLSYEESLINLYNQMLSKIKNEFMETIDMVRIRWKVGDGYKEIRLEGSLIKKLPKNNLFFEGVLDLSYSPKLISLYRIYPKSQRPSNILLPVEDIEFNKWIHKNSYMIKLETNEIQKIKYAKVNKVAI